jgi:hypothetical protein
MTRNQKIALGCGGAGCLGLIVVAIAGVLIYYFAYASPSRNDNFNTSTNRNSNANDNSDFSTNTNDDENDNTSESSASSSASVSSMSDDEKHRLYHAALVTSDEDLIRRVSVKLGLLNDDFTPGDEMAQFLASHAVWAFSNTDFIKTIDTPGKPRTYVNENFPN